MRDPTDDMVLEAAVAGGCKYIVTFNTKDFAGVERFGIRALWPGDFLKPGEMKMIAMQVGRQYHMGRLEMTHAQ